MNIWRKSVLGSGNSKYKDMVAGMCLVWSRNFNEGDVAAVVRVKRIVVDGSQRGKTGQVT